MNPMEIILDQDVSDKARKIEIALQNNDYKTIRGFNLLCDSQCNLESIETIDYLLTEENFSTIFAKLSNVLIWMKNKDPFKVIKYTYEIIRKNEKMQHNCKKGCSYCCHQNVNVLIPEFQKIKKHIGSDIYRYKEKIGMQSDWILADWQINSLEDRRCMFLSNNECSIYDVRPMTCRHHLVESDPFFCELEPGKVRNIINTKTSLAVGACAIKYDIKPMATGLALCT